MPNAQTSAAPVLHDSTRSRNRFGRWRDGFTLLELLVVIAIIALLIAILLPSLSGARCEGQKTKCLANIRSIGQALSTYSIEDPGGYSTPIHPSFEDWLYDGEYEYGGETGLGVFADPDFRREQRILNRYIYSDQGSADMNLFKCPTDRGVEDAPVDFETFFTTGAGKDKPVHVGTGTSYRLNNHIDFLDQTPYADFFYGPYFRPLTRIPSTSDTVVLEETVAEAAKWNASTYVTKGWHCKVNRFNVGFADGHAAIIYLAGQQDLSAQYPDYWILRGDGWRMDCYPDARIEDKY